VAIPRYALLHRPVKTMTPRRAAFQIKSNLFCDTKIQIPMKECKIKINVPTGHKGSKELH